MTEKFLRHANDEIFCKVIGDDFVCQRDHPVAQKKDAMVSDPAKYMCMVFDLIFSFFSTLLYGDYKFLDRGFV